MAIRSLRSLGVLATVDDFATGLSALGRLLGLPVDRLKIDRGFVHDLPGDEADARTVHIIVAIARALRLQVTAEGVKTKAQLRLIQPKQCDPAQGFLPSRPVAPERIPELCAQAERLSGYGA